MIDMFSLTRLFFFLSGSGDTLRFYFDFMLRRRSLSPCLLHPGNPDDRDM